MNSHEATITYSQALSSGYARLHLDLFPAIPSSYGAQHNALVSAFRLVETREVSGLLSLRSEVPLPDLLTFLGSSWNEALARWPELAAMNAYRQEHGTDAYTCVDSWIKFYQLLGEHVLPERIELAAIEQP